MLVIKRKEGQKIVLYTPAGPVTLTFVESVGRAIRLGIEAPLSVQVFRSELLAPEQSITPTLQEGVAS